MIWSRRLFSELFGTFLLVLAGAGAGVVNAVSHGAISRPAAVTAPGLTVMAVILFMGAVLGAHLNPAVTIAFWPARRLPLAARPRLRGRAARRCDSSPAFSLGGVRQGGSLGATGPGRGIEKAHALLIELALTVGLVGTILGTASRPQNVGPLSAVASAATSFSPGSGRARSAARR